jgi:UDP-N-acetylglucosamine diphosphorylase / glucose-1-phosphate thymidylyltransferase / UDP-N-acetylgalactosamine diphosphorylase / glucosamine-1-phosphate N-acetyltransferase / galactosamine-1-phosphate N-acetyltransferase
MRFCVFEDENVGRLAPLGQTRPVFDLRCGSITLRERQQRWFGARTATALVSPERLAISRLACPDVEPLDAAAPLPGALVLVNARWLPPSAVAVEPPGRGVYLVGDEVAFAVVHVTDLRGRNAAEVVASLAVELPKRPAGGALVRYPWELVEQNAAALKQDCVHWRASRASATIPAGVTVIGPVEQVLLDPSARVEPHVVLDATHGPVLIDREATVQAFSRLDGPCYVGSRTQMLAARVKNASFGPDCRIGGEVESTVVQGYSNKAHEGFLGHSYVGEWVNLGAGTFTSDLRTDYGAVRMNVGGRSVDTGLIKVGAFFGDHVKTSIGTLLNTGSTVGPFALLLTSGSLLPREIPAFCRFGHGRLSERTDLGQMFETAGIAMARRNREWTETHADVYLDLYERTAEERRRSLRECEQRRLRRVV